MTRSDYENRIGVTIRPAKEDDAPEIARVVRESYRHLPASHIPFDMPLYHAEFHAEQMLDPATRWAVLCEQGMPMGLAMWRMLPSLAHLHMLFVDGSRQGRGYGVKLLRHYQHGAHEEERGLRLYTLHCLRDSQWAIRFYRNHGYTMYADGDEWRIPDLVVWIDACKRHDNGWPLRADKSLWYKRVGKE